MAWTGSAWVLLCFSLFPVRHPGADPGTARYNALKKHPKFWARRVFGSLRSMAQPDCWVISWIKYLLSQHVHASYFTLWTSIFPRLSQDFALDQIFMWRLSSHGSCGEKLLFLVAIIPTQTSTHPPYRRLFLWKHIEVNLSQHFWIVGPQIKVSPPFYHFHHWFKDVRCQPIFGVIWHVGHENWHRIVYDGLGSYSVMS